MIANRAAKPVPATVVEASSNVFFIREVNQLCFSREFHFHEECQLVYIIKGSGKRIIGDSIENFKEGELILIGPNLPHVWNNHHQGGESSTPSVSLSLFISPAKFKEFLSVFGDMRRTDTLFGTASRGMLINEQCKQQIINLLLTATRQSGFEQVVTLLNLINVLGQTGDYQLLASPTYINRIPFNDNERMNRVYHYLMENFKKTIQFQQIADLAGMNPNAFCRFFKSRTQKSLTQFVNEIRIGHACKLLMENDESISQIAYECGFNNVSNFNHFFKVLKKISPSEFRREYGQYLYA
ncbi:MAG: AraC family transcriptional regulator [Bacteroidota bacterium]